MPDEIELSSPNWGALTGGNTEDKWVADRLRKFGRIMTTAPAISSLSEKLALEGALYRCDPAILRQHPSAAEWYVSLACFAGKTLKHLQRRAKDEFNLSVLPERFISNIETRPESVADADLSAFSAWINSELEEIIGDGLDQEKLAALHVSMIAGGRIIGQGQNEGGDLAVAMLKQALIDHFGSRDGWEYQTDGSTEWFSVRNDLKVALGAPMWKHQNSATLFDFRRGGNRPDIKVSKAETILLVGEVKGRKDLSNTWESWMPTVASHMFSWVRSYPDAYRGAFMTVFTDEMVNGNSANNPEQREGFKSLHQKGVLHYAINLSLVSSNDKSMTDQFRELFAIVLGLPFD